MSPQNVIVRPWEKQDAEALVQTANNINIWNNVRDALPSPYTITDAHQWIAQVADENPIMNFAILSEGQIAGSIGCIIGKDISRKTIEIGYFVREDFWGRGIATEAVRQLLNYIVKQFDCIRIEAHVFARNKSSMKVLQKNGFYLEAILRKAAIKNNEIIDDYVWVRLIR
jgi:[ribosomal protein S5]-alanine N-acetyltransferase